MEAGTRRSDPIAKSHLRIPLEFRWGVNGHFDINCDVDTYFHHGLRSGPGTKGLSELHFGSKYTWNKWLRPVWDTAFGFNSSISARRPPPDLTDGHNHFTPYMVFGRRLDRGPGLSSYLQASVDLTSRPPEDCAGFPPVDNGPFTMKKSLGAKTLVYPTPVFVVGTYDQQGKPNAMTASWGGICCSQPPCVAVSLRKATYSHGNIVARKAFTISLPPARHVAAADYFGTASGRSVDKFAATRLTPVRSELVDAPYVQEFPLVLECRLVHTFELGLHTQFVGEILDVKADEEVLRPDGHPDVKKLQPLVFAPGAQEYHEIGKVIDRAFATRGKP